MDARDPERPKFSVPEAQMIAGNLFYIGSGISDIRELPSERDQNFHITVTSGQEYILKISAASEKIGILSMQNSAMHYLAKNIVGQSSPSVHKSRNGIEIEQVKSETGIKHYVRLLSFLPGRRFSQINPQSPDLLEDLGRFVGSISNGLRGFNHQSAHRDFYWDLKKAKTVIADYSKHITDPAKRELVSYFLNLYETLVLPLVDHLRESVVHNDANDNNIIVVHPHLKGHRRFGIIDFGDMVHSCTINELAITIAYAILEKPDPISVAQEITSGYHAVFPISELELEIIFPLVCARLATSVSVSAYQKTLELENEYLVISEASAWQTLTQLRDIPPRYFTYCLRASLGLEPCPSSAEIREWLKDNSGNFASPIGKPIDDSNSIVVDLSVGSPDAVPFLQLVENDLTTEDPLRTIIRTDADIGIGRYDEPRLIYGGDQYSSAGNETRTVHIATDLIVRSGTPVYAIYDGTIHSFQDNDKPLDNGPTIIIEHKTTPEGPSFYILYAHLSRESLSGLEIGKQVKKGEQIGTVGVYPENGGWPPHLHFQLIADMMGLKGDFFGVAPPSKRNIWLSICPDSNLILQIPDSLFPESRLTKSEILDIRSKHIGKSLGMSYKRPLHIIRGFMQYLYDDEGRQYLDVRNNVPHVGHSNPYVVQALSKQASVLNTNTRYLHENLVRYAQRLSSKMPGDLKVCFFVNSGSEANELALRLAMAHTKNRDLIVIDGAYHGNTDNLIGLSPYKHNGPGGKGPPPHVHMVEMPDPYRGKYKHSDSDAGKKYAEDVSNAIQDIEKQNKGVCAFICEPLMGCGGQIIFPDGYLKDVFKRVRAAGGVCIADEVQIGFGRVGTHFWGFETQGVIPEIVTMGKPIGNGHPIGAVITTPEIAESFNTGMEFFSTTGGNTVSCAVGLAVLEVIENENLQQHALEVGEYLLSKLESLRENHQIIGDVRGVGLFIGVELVRNLQTLEPADIEAKYVVERLKDLGLLVSVDGPFNNVLKIKPPLVFTKENADTLVANLDRVLLEDPIRLN